VRTKVERIVHLIGATERGGAQTFIMNVFRLIDREKYSFDFYVARKAKGEYDDEIKRFGGRIIYCENVSAKSKVLQMIREYRRDKQFFRSHPEYRTIHVHTNSAVSVILLAAAKAAGVRKRIIHSHSTNTKNQSTHKLFRPFLPLFATDMVACGKEAGKWMYGHAFRKENIINNAIDVENFAFNETCRKDYRERFGLGDKTVIGHVGRFSAVKNHDFLLRVFMEYNRIDPDSVLVLVGSGELMPQIKDTAKEMGLADKVIFTRDREDVNRILNVFDVFVMPSHHEGIPIVLVEAQANGLPVIASDRISVECKATPLISFLPLERGPREWAMAIGEVIGKEDKAVTGRDSSAALKGGRYDMYEQLVRIENLYSY